MALHRSTSPAADLISSSVGFEDLMMGFFTNSMDGDEGKFLKCFKLLIKIIDRVGFLTLESLSTLKIRPSQ